MRIITLLFVVTIQESLAMQITRPWTTKHWCESVIRPEWPFAYSKYNGQLEETKGRVSDNMQDVRHECNVRGVRSKCHICEDIACGPGEDKDQTCHFQLQGVSWKDMSINIPTVSDVPWAVNGSHRYDFGGTSTTHVCMYLSGTPPCQSSFGDDYSDCKLRCWGHGESMSGEDSTAALVTNMEGKLPDGQWPNHRVDSLQGVNSTPWELPSPTMAWNYPRYPDSTNIPMNPNAGEKYSFNPQGFVFTMAGSQNGEEGFLDGTGSDARFRHPEGVAVDHDGYAYIADTGNHAVRMISPSGKVSTIAGTGAPGNEDGFATEGAQFSSPADIAVWRDWSWWPYPNPIDPDSVLYRNGNGTLALFVADTANHRIRKISGVVEFDPDSGEKIWSNVTVECFSGRCDKNPEPGFADGKKVNTRFDAPLGLTVSSDGRVFVADTNNHLIRMIDQFGTATTIAGSVNRYEANPNVHSIIQSRLNYPSDVALGSNDGAVIVTDRHHIHNVNLGDGTMATLAGGENEGDRDGDGSESTLNNPTSIAVTGDGVAYVADSASCRIRRASNTLFALQASCLDSLTSIMRPNGCSSYNIPIDEYGIGATPVEGNIYYNHQFRDEFDIDLGQNFIGRSLKNCVGSPPMSRLDKKYWNETTSSLPFNHNLVIDDNKTRIREDPNDGTRVTVACNSNCSNVGKFSAMPLVTGVSGFAVANVYSEESSVCAAALNEGILDESGMGLVDVTIISEDRLGDQIDIDSTWTGQFYIVSKSSQEVRLQTISGAPVSLLGRSCGFRDTFPPQSSMFYHPSGLGAFVNATLDDASYLLFIADRDNHAIRGMSAACSFRCENNGRCVGPDKCECALGWSGIDCTKPVCQNSCGQRQLCIAPDTCDCIPGYHGNDCIVAKCAQDCANGHCSAPDVCTCTPGWFDSNCTTPVCEQTCGNGGNCTGPDTCTCPKDYTGVDCRTPVCEQECSHGGWCVAPNTCQCPPDYSGYDCSYPVCHQGFFVPFIELPEWMIEPATKSHWLEYQPCNFTSWCDETSGFDCAQTERGSSPETPHFGMNWRYKTGRKYKPTTCMMLELEKDAISHFQYMSSLDNSSTPHHRYSPNLPYDWYSNERLPWNAFHSPEPQFTQPYKSSQDRQVALAAYQNITQGAYMCANGGKCASPDVCSCAKGWIGFDCRVPICEQGYYEPELGAFVKNVKSDEDIATFEPFLDPRRPYDLDSSRGFSSNPDVSVWTERFLNGSTVRRNLTVTNGAQYLDDNGSQGGYECSLRGVTQWESYRSGYVFEHPNYFSKYMDEKIEDDGSIYSHWKGMDFPPTHRKTAKLIKYGHEFTHQHNSTTERSFIYTDVGHMKDGVWKVTGASWKKGNCIVEFARHCDDDSGEPSVAFVQDTDESYRPMITYDDKRAHITGRWFASKSDVCVDHVVRGCFNNGTCIAPNTCQCAPGWSGNDCSVPVCDQVCLHNGNCTHPNICTCERGWSGHDCSVAMCAQDCHHGRCVAPDTCKCDQWENEWRDGRVGGGVPLFQKPNGDPQMTGYTGYDCNTPICVQAERFRLNVDTSASVPGEVVPLGGHGKDGALECNDARCPEYDKMVTQNDGKSWQGGCGWDALETGCCFEVDDITARYHCFRCENLLVSARNATCAHGGLKEWTFESSSKVPLAFRTRGEILQCGPYLNPDTASTSNLNYPISTTSNLFLCNVWQWEQGDYMDDADLHSEPGLGADFGLESGRHIRVNYNNYQQSDTLDTRSSSAKWVAGPKIRGEGIYECYNKGSCISPDTCSCKDGYGGYDCATPICRHDQVTGDIVGCQNLGVCVAKDGCQCIKQVSVLWKVHKEAERGLTGWTGTDCSMPMCMQGYHDPVCNVSAAPGKEGCYRCANGGICVAPDLCQCAEGWSGYDCRTPVCKAEATPLIRKQLMTSDAIKIRIFEENPCSMVGFSSLHNEGPRGVCSLPNQCTCNCQGSYDEELCRRVGGKYCQTPFHDPLFRDRDVLAPNEVFGTRNCYSGYEGLVDVNDNFSSCHLRIYEPSFYYRHTRAVISLSILSGISLCLLAAKLWVTFTRQKQSIRKERMRSVQRTNTGHAFGYDSKNITKQEKNE